jgi:hypothetical protein
MYLDTEKETQNDPYLILALRSVASPAPRHAMTSSNDSRPFRIRTINAFVNLHPDDFVVIDEVVLVDDAGNSKTTEKLLGGGGVLC